MDIQSAIQQTDLGNTRENASVSALRQNLEQTEKMSKITQQISSSAPVSETRGTLIDILV
ncbi:MAG: hypothetical protein KAJ40_01910 [Alphaproteobacteria bacterium]|nr:hypothetical protein [Alphaproteobacteria bacterium]